MGRKTISLIKTLSLLCILASCSGVSTLSSGGDLDSHGSAPEPLASSNSTSRSISSLPASSAADNDSSSSSPSSSSAISSKDSTTPMDASSSRASQSSSSLSASSSTEELTPIEVTLDEYSYVALEEKQGRMCVVIEGDYSGRQPEPSDFVLNDDAIKVGNKTILCFDIVFDGNHFRAYFDFGGFCSGDTTYQVYYPHLLIDGSPFFGDYGDLIAYRGGAMVPAPRAYVPFDGRGYRLSSLSDDYPMAVITCEIDVSLTLSQTNPVSLTMEDDKPIFTIYGEYPEDIALDRHSLTLEDGDKGRLECEEVSLNEDDNMTEFAAKFDISPLWDNLRDNGDGVHYLRFWSHLMLNHDGFDGQYGQMKVASASAELKYGARLIRVASFSDSSNLDLLLTEIESIAFTGFLPNENDSNQDNVASTYETYYGNTLAVEEDRAIFTVRGHFGGTYGEYSFQKEEILLKDGGVEVECSSVEFEDPGADYEGGTRFIAKFDLTDIVLPENSVNFYAHVLFNGNVFDGDHGDLRPGEFRNKGYNWQKKGESIIVNGRKFSLFAVYHEDNRPAMVAFDIHEV